MSYTCRGDNWSCTPNKHDEVICGVCGDKMTKTFRKGVQCWAAAMTGNNKDKDEWWCPHTKLDWHRQARALKEEAAKTPSSILRQLYLAEASEVLEERKPTQ